MGLRIRMLTGIRRAMRCGGRALRCFSGRWRDRIRFEQRANERGVTVRVAPRFVSCGPEIPKAKRNPSTAQPGVRPGEAHGTQTSRVANARKSQAAPLAMTRLRWLERRSKSNIGHVGFSALVADDGNFGVGNFEPNEAMGAVEQKKDLNVGSGDFEAFVSFAVGSG